VLEGRIYVQLRFTSLMEIIIVHGDANSMRSSQT